MEGYGKIKQPFWDDKPVAVVGGGPSLTDFDFEQLRGAHVLAIKDMASHLPWADAVLGIGEWDNLDDVQARVYWATANGIAPQSKNVTRLRHVPAVEVSNDPSVINGVTCEFGSMQICIHKRARQIVLFGFDHEGEEWEKRARHFTVLVPHLIERGISVVNACPTSSINCFQKVTTLDGVRILNSE